jgi:hypothetical protein
LKDKKSAGLKPKRIFLAKPICIIIASASQDWFVPTGQAGASS